MRWGYFTETSDASGGAVLRRSAGAQFRNFFHAIRTMHYDVMFQIKNVHKKIKYFFSKPFANNRRIPVLFLKKNRGFSSSEGG